MRVDQILNAKRDFRGRFAVTLRQRPERLRCNDAHGYQFRRMCAKWHPGGKLKDMWSQAL